AHVVQDRRRPAGQPAQQQGLQEDDEVVADGDAGHFGVRWFGGPHHVDEQLLLAAPAAVDGGLADARGAGDALDGQLGEGHAVLRELHHALDGGAFARLAAETSAGRDLLAEGGALLGGAGVGGAHVAASFPWAGVAGRRGAAAPAGAPPVVGRPPGGGGRGARDRGRSE